MREATSQQTTWTAFQIEPDLMVTVTAARPVLSPEVERQVEAIWTAASAEKPGLFNGDVYSVARITPERIVGHWTEYRRIVAQTRAPSLKSILDVRPLAVAGLIESPDGIVFGLRSADMVYQPGMWQLAPAGNVDPASVRDGHIDLCAALATELQEELGLTCESVTWSRAVCAVQHAPLNIVDICIALRTSLSAGEILSRHAADGDFEYPRVAVVARDRLPAFLGGSDGPVAPQTHLFLAAYDLAAGACGPAAAQDC